MGRRKNKNRHQKTHPNSKVGQKAVYFANDQNNHHPRGGNSNTFAPHSRSGPPRHGGNNSNNNNRGQGPRNNRNQHRDPNSNFNAYNPNNAPNTNTRNRKPRRRGDPNSNHNHNHNTINNASDLDTLLDAIASSPFSSTPPPHAKPGARSCIECSGVRRANLRFRNWAHAALQQCGERFAAWAEDAGVGFAGPDEMDWQPEPVIRVLLVDGSEGEKEREQQQRQWVQREQQQMMMEQYQQQQQYLQNAGNIGPIPCPGPWPWPPWCDSGPPDPSVWPVRVPSCGLPVLPAAASEVLPPPPGPECCVTTASPPTPVPPAVSAACFGNAGVCCPTPVPGCGIVGAGAGGVCGLGGEFSPSGRVLSPCPECDAGRPKETVSIPTRTVMEQSATTGTCGPTFRPWGARRRSSCEGALCCG
ncbi:hypothetical protein F5Y13DRAFT_19299 [Hypoxylon sp. FL1857]|nr:hypothetical protein F5Y13DRAFT_19299 [Hypoxylon sp. FL1857]